MFVQSLDGEVRKWFRELPANSITLIEELHDVFMRQWGDRKDHTYYITEFGDLRRKNDETISAFSKCFRKMYGRIPAKIKPSETSAKLTYTNAFDHEFSLHLRERRPITLLNMQEAALEVESNISASNRLKENSRFGIKENYRLGASPLVDNSLYRKLIGSLLYLTHS